MAPIGIDDWDELGPPETRPVPKGSPWRTAGIAAAVLAGVLLLATGVWLVYRDATQPERAVQTGVPSNQIIESFTATGPSGATTSAVTTQQPGPAATPPATPTVTGRVAYRSGASVWVASEAGTGPKRLYGSKTGAFSLSPDGKTLAVVDAGARKLALVDVASARITTVAPAEPDDIAWAPSSAWLAFTASSDSQNIVQRVGRNASGLKTIGKGHLPRISPDSTDVAFVAAVGGGVGPVAISVDGGTPKTLGTGGVSDIALGTDRVYFGVAATSTALLAVRSCTYSGGDVRQVVGPPSELRVVSYADFALSPNGVWLAYTVTGDDGFSRLYGVRADASTPRVSLSKRRDDYMVGWSAGGTRILFVEGNAVQGESTDLMSVMPDATGRLTIVSGGGR